ncbi:MYND-type domain-containing protein [Favolaschia claudopus]|uniref:MYND-type domain-containing protein n=1 Tax=Favolaschia claudopus TaxID=2862362 RepID=A0AAW0CW24_9AGAR
MAQPLYWPGQYYFYPIGNTAAVSLARDVPPDKDITLLLMGCGDPRNVLFTLFSEHENARHKLDFTCIDFEPAVLARNILLLSMVIDNRPPDLIFNIFFHMFLEPGSLALLVTQCQALIQSSTTLATWQTSSYGSSLRMSTEYTLDKIRWHWEQYSRMHQLPRVELLSIQERFRAGVAECQKKNQTSNDVVSITIHPSRSAGPLMMKAIPTLASLFRAYWQHGTTFTSVPRRSSATLLNPTFVYTQSGIGCNVHYGTDPVIPFHLAPIFGNRKPSSEDIMMGIRLQFQEWCGAFYKYHIHGQCTIRVFCADAVFATRALQKLASKAKGNVPIKQWQTGTITLDKTEYQAAPLTFDVVDTSNLDDDLGLLNVVTIALPLLKSSANSVLYTESLLAHSNSDGETPKDFVHRFHADLAVMSIVFGICPVDFATGYSTRGNVHELITYKALHQQGQYHQLTVWKHLVCGSLTIRPQQLGTFLYDLYHAYFENEEAEVFWNKNRVNPMQGVGQSSLSHHNRETFALFLCLVRNRLQISEHEWIATMDRFFSIHKAQNSEDPAKPSLKMENLKFQDFCALLHLHGVYKMDMLQGDVPKIGPFQSWAQVSPVVRVFLIVPRKQLNVLIQRQAATPTLEAGVRGIRMNNLFSSVHAAFGTITMTGSQTDPKVVFTGDLKGMSGSMPLVVSFTMPAWLLTGDPGTELPKDIHITLACKSNAQNIMLYGQDLRDRLELFSARLLDHEHVIVLPEQSDTSGHSMFSNLVFPVTGSLGSQSPISVLFDEECALVESFSVKINVENEHPRLTLQHNGSPSIKQRSLTSIEVTLGNVSQTIAFPFPIIGSKCRLRVARKSFWLELIVPLCDSQSLILQEFTVDPFPIVIPEIMPWSVHRVNLQSLPTVDLANKELYDWLNPHIGGAFSRRESKARQKKENDPLMFVKDTIHSIVVRASGIQPKGASPHNIFGLRDKATKTCDTLLLVDRLCFDLSSHTIVCDGYVLPLSSPRMDEMGQNFHRLVPDIKDLYLEPGEITAWKNLLPVLVERCRTWQHLDSCQYAQTGQVPLTTEYDIIPLCVCGEGKNAKEISKQALWKPLAKYCTKIALGPLFGVSYVEDILKTDRRCYVCRKKASMTCLECKKDRYCGKACQKADWKRHKVAHHDILSG